MDTTDSSRPITTTTNMHTPSSTGATSQTSGFTSASQPAYVPPAAGLLVAGMPSLGGFGGGLASSPNVPKPGSTINPATGKPHTEGLTRAELAAMQEKGKDLLDPTPQAVAARRGSSAVADERAGGGARRLSELSGREQAAKQLVGGVGTTQSSAVKDAPPQTSIYEDVAGGLKNITTTAYAALPSGFREVFLNEPASPKPSGGLSPPPAQGGRRGSAAILREQAKVGLDQAKLGLDQAKLQTNKIVHQAQETLQNRNADGGVLTQMKGFLGEVIGTAGPTGPSLHSQPQRKSVSGLSAPKTSLPTNEPAGAMPGEHSSGVGALPGPSTETGVAVLPDEKKAASTPRMENQGMLPGEVSPTSVTREEKAGPSGTSSEPPIAATESAPEAVSMPAISEVSAPTGVSAPAEVSPTSEVPAPTEASAPSVDAAPAATSTSTSEAYTSPPAMTDDDDFVPRSGTAPGYYSGLAMALPSTFLGQGADKGATDVKTIPGINESTETTTTSSSSPFTTSSAMLSPGAADTRGANDRTNSSASVTAIRGGYEGSRSSPLAGDSVIPSTISEVGQKSTTPGTGPNHTTSLAPGSEEDGIGHPSTQGLEGATREVGTYPSPEHDVPSSAQGGEMDMGSMTGTDAGTPEFFNASEDIAGTREYPTETLGAAGTDSMIGSGAGAGAGVGAGAGAGAAGAGAGTESSTLGSVGVVNPTTETSSATTTPSRTTTTTTTNGTTATPGSPVQKFTSQEGGSAHHRTESNASSDGGKKRGFMSKLKEKLTHHD